jgi:hypothetical protein
MRCLDARRKGCGIEEKEGGGWGEGGGGLHVAVQDSVEAAGCGFRGSGAGR